MTFREAMPLTPLEHELLKRLWLQYDLYQFPHPDMVSVTKRVNTGAGRYTYLQHPGLVDCANGCLVAGNYSQFDMDNMPYGAFYNVEIKEKKAFKLEIISNGLEFWDGSEKMWSIRNPETGERE
jgi:hypothetical protein